MLLMRRFLENDVNELHAENVRLRVIGTRDRLSSRLVRLIEWAKRKQPEIPDSISASP